MAVTERDTYLHEINDLKRELFNTYRDMAILKGENPMTPGEQDLLEKIKTSL